MASSDHKYVHGYTQREDTRLIDQATTLTELLHRDTSYPAGSSVLEAGCGVGAQTVTLLKNSPEAHFTSIDLSLESLDAARERVSRPIFSICLLKTMPLIIFLYASFLST